MADPNIVQPAGSSYSLPQPTTSNIGDIPKMSLDRTLPRQLSTGSTRGTQTVGYGNTKIDGSNNRITIGTPEGGSIGMGAIPGTTPTEYGFFSTDSQGRLVMKIVGGTWYVYDLDNDKNIMQTGKLPDNSFGGVVAKEGYNVSDVFNG